MTYSELDIMNFVDGRLGDEERIKFESVMKSDPELAHAVAIMKASDLPIKKAYEQQPLAEVPQSLKDTLSSLGNTHQNRPNLSPDRESDVELRTAASEYKAVDRGGMVTNQTKPQESTPFARHTGKRSLGWPLATGLAACLLGGIGIGFIAGMQRSISDETTHFQLAQHPTASEKHEQLVERIADYQSLYVENTVAALPENSKESATTLLGLLKRQHQINTAIPDFSAFGYEFARAQQLGFEGNILVQLVYKKPGKTPLAFCYMPGASIESLPLNATELHQLQVVSWVAQHQHYVLVADESTLTTQEMQRKALAIF